METQTYKNLKDKPQNNFPKMIIVHHSGGTDKDPLFDTSNQTAQIIEDWHFKLGWQGVGYHYIIHKNGEVWKGRPETYNGSHCIDHNTDSIGICVVGNFDVTLPTKEQENALAGLIASIKARYPAITQDKIYPHRKFANKSCYGKLLKDDWARNLVWVNPDKPNDKQSIKDQIKKLIDQL